MAATPGSENLFPLFVDLRGRRVVVVGGGNVARRKVAALLAVGARVRVVAPAPVHELRAWAEDGRIELTEAPFSPELLDDAWLVVGATDDRAVNTAVAVAAAERRLWANVVDDASLSSVQVPARVERGPLQVAISSGGGAPMLARHLRERLEAEFDESWSALAQLLTRYRRVIRARFADIGARRDFFERVLAGDVPTLLRAGRSAQARAAFRTLLAHEPARRRAGRVVLVGAGPGDAGLLTLRALRVLSQADVVLHDRLVSGDVLARIRRDAELIDVGKQAGGPGSHEAHASTQSRIHALMLEHARAGKVVVRLKGGDPFVFGRGGEELEALAAHGIAFEVVPGVTAAIACAAYAGIPLTHRDHAQSLRFVTAHARDEDRLDWAALAAPNQTTAFYMGVAAAPRIAARLVRHGMPGSTPVAIVENGSRADQRVVVGRLDTLVDDIRRHAVRSPALLIVGDVAALAHRLHWFGAAPLGAAPPLERAA